MDPPVRQSVHPSVRGLTVVEKRVVNAETCIRRETAVYGGCFYTPKNSDYHMPRVHLGWPLYVRGVKSLATGTTRDAVTRRSPVDLPRLHPTT